MSDLRLTVEGKTGSGKTALLWKIQQLLLREGIATLVQDRELAAELCETERLEAALHVSPPVVILVEQNHSVLEDWQP